jgi:hypothetical protein
MEDQIKSDGIDTNEEEFTSDYANNTYLVPTAWDLKLVFGELAISSRAIDWHTSITLPWAQAKLMAYYLDLNIAAYEKHNGTIKVPPSMLPPAPPPIQEADKDNPAVQSLVEYIRERRQKFLDGLK